MWLFQLAQQILNTTLAYLHSTTCRHKAGIRQATTEDSKESLLRQKRGRKPSFLFILF